MSKKFRTFATKKESNKERNSLIYFNEEWNMSKDITEDFITEDFINEAIEYVFKNYKDPTSYMNNRQREEFNKAFQEHVQNYTKENDDKGTSI